MRKKLSRVELGQQVMVSPPRHLLWLLVTLLPLSRANLYYVSPTSTSTSDTVHCPATGEPCLPLNYYANGNYFTSNSVFKFLPGNHTIERPLTLFLLQNVTLEAAESGSPPPVIKLQSEIVCHKRDLSFGGGDFLAVPTCSSIFFQRCSNLVLRGLRVQSTIRWDFYIGSTLWLVAGEISFDHAENVLVENVSAERGLCFITSLGAINITGSRFGQLDSLESQCDHPFTAKTYARYGLYIFDATNVSLSNVTVVGAQLYGIYLHDTRDTLIEGMVSINTLFGSALALKLARNTRIRSPVLDICSAGYIPSLNVTTSINAVIEGVSMIDSPGSIMVVDSINLKFVSLIMVSKEGTQPKRTAVFIYTCTNITFQNSVFTGSAFPDGLFTDVISLPSIFYAHFSLGIRFQDCTFSRNEKTAINARASDIVFSGNISFLNSSAPSGVGIIISKESNVTLEENCSVVFRGNHAVSSGGAIYIVTGEDVPEQFDDRWCFLHVKGDRSRPRMTFSDNWAGKAGDVLYGGHLAIGYNGIRDNCLQRFWNVSDISQQESLSVVSSESSRVCLCDSEGELPDCLRIHSEPHVIYPGETISLSVVVVGQAFGSVTGSVFARFLQESTDEAVPSLVSSQYTQVVGKESCNVLNYTIFKTVENGSSDAILTLTPQFRETSLYLSNNSTTVKRALLKYKWWARMYPLKTPFPKIILEFPVYVNLTLLPCPLGFVLRGDPGAKCECDQLLLALSGVDCDITDQTVSRSGLLWIGVDDRENSSGTLMTSKYCPLNYCKSETVRMNEGEYDTQCNYGHSGTLCGQCKEGLSLALGSSQCLSCSNRYLVLIFPFLLAGLALVAFIKLTNLTIAHGTINGLILYVNIVKANEFIFLPGAGANPLTLFISWTNLDLGIETCFWDGLTAYSKTWLQFLFPVYIWGIAGGIVFLSKYSSKLAGLMGSNSVSVLATLFFLSYSKLLRIIIVGLSYTVIESSDGQRIVWSSDGNLDYLGTRHAPLFAACLVALIFVWLPYTLLLFCGQWLYKIKCRPVVKLLGRITPFLDTHYAPLKGRHRYWFGAQLLIRAAILIISSVVPADSSSTVVFSISAAAVVLTALSFVGFYQNKLVSFFEMTFFANLSLLGISAFFTESIGKNAKAPTCLFISVAFLQFVVLVAYHISTRFKVTRILQSCCNWVANKKGLNYMLEDHWEMIVTEERRREEGVQEGETRETTCSQEEGQGSGKENSGRTY